MVVKKVALNALALATGGIVAQVCFLFIEALIARRLGSEAYGTYGTVYAIALQAGCIAEMGMAWKLLEEGSRDHAAIPRILGTTIVLKLVFCGLLYLPMLALLQLLGYSQEVIGFFSIFFGYAVLLAVQDSLAAVYAAHQRMHVSALFQGAIPVAILACVAIATQFAHQLETIAWAYIAGAALVVSIWTWRTFLAEHPRVEMRRAGEILRGSYLYGITGVLYQIILRIDLVLLSLLREMSEVGLFAASDKLADMGLKAGTLSARVISPVLFAQSRHDPEGYRRTCKLVIRGVSVIGVFGCVALALLAEPLLVAVFGKPFGAATARATADGLYVCSMLGARALPIPRSTAIAAVLGPVMIGALAYMATLALPTDFAVRLIAGLAIYAAGLLATRIVRRSDIEELVRIIRLRKSA